MSNTSVYLRSVCKPVTFVTTFVVISIAMIWVGCGPGAPFATYDPPPTFALRYTLQSTGVYYPQGAGTGSSLQGTYMLDIIGTSFTPLGWNRAFGPAWVNFGSYYTVDQGRWPAAWNIAAVAGCGAGASARFDITSKMPEVACVPRMAPMNVLPNSYEGDQPPSGLQVATDPSAAPAGTSVRAYIVRQSDGTVELEQNATVGPNGVFQIGAPWVYDGSFYVVADFMNNPNGYDGAQSELRTYGNPACPYQPPMYCP